jgi:hypothetical protein
LEHHEKVRQSQELRELRGEAPNTSKDQRSRKVSEKDRNEICMMEEIA